MPQVLKLGSTGPDVLRVQRRLRANGHSCPKHGVYDEETAGAVAEFQAGHLDDRGRPLGVDGEVTVGGRYTWWALHHPSRRAQAQPSVPATYDDAIPILARLVGPRLDVLTCAARELGVREDPDGSNGGPRVDVYTGAWRVPWCALFVSWCRSQALGGPAFPPHAARASVQKIARWASSTGCAVVDREWPSPAPDLLDGERGDPAAGDVFLMLDPGGDAVDSGRGHTGFVLDVGPAHVLTVEGNCANAVRSRRRPRSTIAGYARAT